MKVLIVEDDKVAQKIEKYIVQGAGFGVDIADDGKQALQQCHQTTYDLILIDIGLPNNFDGFAVTEAIRQIKGFTQVPIVALTAHTESIYRERAPKVGMNHLLMKPLTEKSLKMICKQFGILERQASCVD